MHLFKLGMSQDLVDLVDGIGKTVELSLEQFDPSIEANNEINRECGDSFNILGLPTELISHVFSFLSMEDRLRARVNKRLDAIELASKYYVECVLIEEAEEMPIEVKEWLMEMKDAVDDEVEEVKEYEEISQRITFYKGKPYSSDCIRRIAQNVSVGNLRIKLTGSNEFHREVFNLIKDFNIEGDLDLEHMYNDLLKEILVDSFVFDLSRACKFLNLNAVCEKITPEGLHQLYKNIIEGSTKLRGLFMRSCNDQYIAFLGLIGITYRDDAVFSNKDIEVYEWQGGNGTRFKHSIFDGCLEIVLGRGFLFFMLWEIEEDLQRAKNRENIVKIEVSPE